jgi:hypothetical protein
MSIITRSTTSERAPNWTEVEKMSAGRWAFAPPDPEAIIFTTTAPEKRGEK